MSSARATPLFALIALLSLAALATRFQALAALTPPGAQLGLVAAVVALTVLGAHFASVVTPPSGVELPLWMRLLGAARAAFGLSFTFLAVVALQTLKISLGPIDPSPPESWPLATRAQYFAMMSVGMFFPNYLAATSVMVPALMVLVRPFQKLKSVGVVLTALVGVALGAGVAALVASQSAAHAVAEGQRLWSAADAAVGGAVTLGMILLPIAWGIVSEGREEHPPETPAR